MGGYVEVAKKNITWHFPWKLLRFHEFFKVLLLVHVDDTKNILVEYTWSQIRALKMFFNTLWGVKNVSLGNLSSTIRTINMTTIHH